MLLHEFLKKLMLTFRRLPQGLLYDAQATLEELQGHGMVDSSCLRDEAHRKKMAYTDNVQHMNQRWKKMHVLSVHWRA
jgi:hypothetical protein